MALIKLPDNGQQFEIDDDQVSTDDKVRAVLAPVYPEVKNAKINRTKEGDVLVISIVKQAGTKGLDPTAQAPLSLFEEPGQLEVVELPIGKIRTDGNTQTRAETSRDVAHEYADALKAGAIFPPVKVVLDDEGNYWLYDGFHTTMAHGILDRITIRAQVRSGTKRDAVLLAVGANQAHGLRRTNADKNRAVKILLKDMEWMLWSDREIARVAGVSHTFVSNIRGEMAAESGNGLQNTPRMANRDGEVITFRPALTESDMKAAGQQGFEVPVPEPQSPAPIAETVEPEFIAAPPPPRPAALSGLNAEFVGEQLPPPMATFEATPSPEPEPVVVAPPPAPTPVPTAPAPSTPIAAPTPTLTPVAPSTPLLRPLQLGRPTSVDQAEITITLVLKPDDGNPEGREVSMVASTPGLLGRFKTHRATMYTPWQDPIQDALNYFAEQISPASKDENN